MSELDQDETVEKMAKKAKGKVEANKPAGDLDAPKAPRTVKLGEDGKPLRMRALREGDPETIAGYTVVGRDFDTDALLVEFPVREPVDAMDNGMSCPHCQSRAQISTSGEKLATRSYTVCVNPHCCRLKEEGKPWRGTVTRRLTTNIKRFDEIGVAPDRFGG